MFYDAQKRVINLFNDYAKNISEVNFKATQGRRRPFDLPAQFKILTPEQMLQRLPIALA